MAQERSGDYFPRRVTSPETPTPSPSSMRHLYTRCLVTLCRTAHLPQVNR